MAEPTEAEAKPAVDSEDKSGDKTSEAKPSGGGAAKLDIEEMLDDYGLDSADDLKEFISNLSDMKGRIGDEDLDTLLENSKTLKKYQASWQQQEDAKLKDGETPEETITRLEKDNKALHADGKKSADRQKASKAAEQALGDFSDTVNSVIKSSKSLPKEYRQFTSEFLGVGNPINEVDITDKAAVRRLTKAGVAKMAAFEQAVIKRYRDGKTKIPTVTKTETTPGTTEPKDANPKNLKEAKRIMMESVGAFVK